MRQTEYVLLSAVPAYVENVLLESRSRLNYLQIMPIDPNDPIEEQPGLHDTHVKVFVDLANETEI